MATPHPVLSTPELLREIFDCFLDEYKPNEGEPLDKTVRRALLHAALTCQSFSSPALDVLWRHLDSLIPLLRLFQALEKVDNGYVLKGDINDDEWDKFNYYACRVREINYRGVDRDIIDASVFSRLAAMGGSPLLPSLRSIRFIDVNPPGSDILLFVPPTLEHLHLRVDSLWNEPVEAALVTFLRAIVKNTYSFKYLYFNGHFSNDCLNNIADFTNLRTLRIHRSSVTDAMYQSFSRMTHLIELNINVEGLQLGSLTSHIHFDSLERLTLVGSLSGSARLLASLDAIHLQSVIVATAVHLTRQECVSFFKALRFPSLRHISVVIGSVVTGFTFDIQDVLGSILGLNQVETLFIMLRGSSISMSDGDVLSMAKAWPKIRRLHITHDSRSRVPNLAGLVAFANHCPALADLSLPIKADIGQPFAPPTVTHGLRCIDFLKWSTPSPNPTEVAQALDCLFPYLEVMKTKTGAEGTTQEYQEVVEIVRSLQRKRRR